MSGAREPQVLVVGADPERVAVLGPDEIGLLLRSLNLTVGMLVTGDSIAGGDALAGDLADLHDRIRGVVGELP